MERSLLWSAGPSDLLQARRTELVLVTVMALFGMGLLRQHGGADRTRVLGLDDLDCASALPSTTCVILTSHFTSLDFSFLSV